MRERNQQTCNEVQSLTSTKTTPSQTRIALMVSIILLLVCALAYPSAMSKGPRIPIFFLIFIIPTIFAALITAYLLFGQFLVTRFPSLAILGSVYLYVGLINVPYLLASPAVYAQHPLFSAKQDTAGWLWIFLQIGYPFGILLYVAINKHFSMKQLSPTTARYFLISLLSATVILVALFSYVALDPYHVLPGILTRDPNTPSFTPLIRILIFSLNGLMCIGALFLLRNHSVLHLWLRVSTLAALINVSFNMYATTERYSIGWYVSRTNALMAAALVLCALLYEVNKLYTRLSQQNEELAKQNRIQSDFLSIVGHEFRTALTSILGFSEVMREKDLDDEDIQEYADDIHNDATRLTRLINDLLDLERMKSGRMDMQWEQVEMNALIQEIVCHKYSTTPKDLIRIELDTTPLFVQGDRDKLTQVIMNLLNNALKYSPEGGVILVRSKRDAEMVHLFVQDHGIGIPQEHLEQIFERYARVESSATRYIGGTGLGLPIVRQIMEMHQGKVWAESTIGQGSTFHLMLPIRLHPEIVGKAAQVATT